MLKKFLLTAVVLLCEAGQCFGDIIFQIVSADPASTVVGQATGVVGIGYSRGSGIDAVAGGGTFNSDNFTLNGTESQAVTNNDFLEWSFTSGVNSYDLKTFDLRYDRSPTGPTNLRIDFQSNGGAFATVFTDVAVNVNGEDNAGISLSVIAVTSGKFRLYGWGATDVAGTFDFENAAAIGTNGANPVSFELNGTITAVPEPTSLVLLGIAGCTGLVAAYRRRRSKGCS